MGLQFTQKNDYMIISIDGRLDSLNARQVHEKVEEKLKTCDKDVIFDFEHLEYMTSAGLQVLLMASKNRKSKGKKAYVYKPQKLVDYVIKVSGFYGFMEKLGKMP